MKNPCLSDVSAQNVVPTLEELIGGRVTDVLPVVLNIILDSVVASGPRLSRKTMSSLSLHDSSPASPQAVFLWEVAFLNYYNVPKRI